MRAALLGDAPVPLSEASLYGAEDAAARAKLAHLQAIVGLVGALGGGWTP